MPDSYAVAIIGVGRAGNLLPTALAGVQILLNKDEQLFPSPQP
jgi:phosphoribosylcarboxyaminoimidazole (NCAIR) mutase